MPWAGGDPAPYIFASRMLNECHWHSEPLRAVWELFFLSNILCIFLCALCGKSGGQVGYAKGLGANRPWRRSYLMPSNQCNAQHKRLIGIPEPTVPGQSVTRRFEGRFSCMLYESVQYLPLFCRRTNEFNRINQLWFHLLLD